MRVLLVEDEPSLRESMAELVSELAPVRAAATVEEALEALGSERFALVLTDLRIGGQESGGRDILEAARRRLQPVTLVSAAVPEEVARALRPFEPDAVLVKPFQLDDLLAVVERFLTLRGALERLAASPQPQDSEWNQGLMGVEIARAEGERAGAWVRVRPGVSAPWSEVCRGAGGLLLLEGGIEVDGEPRAAPDYLFLSAGPHEARSAQGCLGVSLALQV
ncbi:response regulator [Myxococcaceae bacterium GXIMD 01537]